MLLGLPDKIHVTINSNFDDFMRSLFFDRKKKSYNCIGTFHLISGNINYSFIRPC